MFWRTSPVTRNLSKRLFKDKYRLRYQEQHPGEAVPEL